MGEIELESKEANVSIRNSFVRTNANLSISSQSLISVTETVISSTS